MKPKKNALMKNILFAALLLAVAGGLWLLGHTRQSGTYALLQYDETEVRIDLAQDGAYDYDTGTYTIHLQVQDGAIRFVDSPCPDHRCESFGWLRAEGDWAACLPAHALVTVMEE